MISLRIKGFALDRSRMPIVILRDETGEQILPILIGPFEASAIIVELENIQPPKPLTHDLFSDIMLRHGLKMDQLEIYDRSAEYHYFARIRYHKGWRRFYMEVRPSDGLAIAVRFGAPIFAEEDLLADPAYPISVLEGLNNPSQEIMYLNTEDKWNTLIM